MIGIYCRGQGHADAELCFACGQLLQYAVHSIDRCPFQADKPTCDGCPIHCYKPGMREQMQHVMRYSGPRMMFFHPLLTILHFIDLLQNKYKKR